MTDYKPQYTTPRTALIDGDIIAYRAAAWTHDNQGDLHDMVDMIEIETLGWQSRAFCNKAFIALSDRRDNNFRREYYPLYKAHRTGEPPAMLGEAKRALSKLAKTITIPKLEADDVMGILATSGKVVNPVMVTIDKDLRSVPGWHFNPDKEDFPVYVTEKQADYAFHIQWLAGDAVDGYHGIKGIGPKRAADILERYEETHMSWAVLEAYDKAHMTVEEALAQARCARILRTEDFEPVNRIAIPWEPTVLSEWLQKREETVGYPTFR